ncbi:MAG: methyltransferase domain-containing protein [Xylophilus ampelinus]
MHPWLATPPGRYLIDWEQTRMDEAVADIFGYRAAQLGLPALDGLRASRIGSRWRVALGHDRDELPGAVLACDAAALPFAPASLDLVLMPHTLERSPDPRTALREAERVLMPEGRIVISGFNPTSLWGMRQRRAALCRRLGGAPRPWVPETGDFVGYLRLRDWLTLLGFEVESSRFGCYRPAVRGQRALDRMAWMDTAGDRWWPIFGAVYFLVAVKRVQGVRPLHRAVARPAPGRLVPAAARAPLPGGAGRSPVAASAADPLPSAYSSTGKTT